MTKTLLIIAACTTFMWTTMADAATDEQKCLAGRAKAQGKFEQCVTGVLSKAYGSDKPLDQEGIHKCVDKYDAAWTKLQKLDQSATCGAVDRLVDGGGTFTDRLTGLTWEKKTNTATVSNVDNAYALNFATSDDGSAYNTFLPGLNDGSLDGAKGWRLPSLTEMLTLLNQTVPGPSQTARHWTTTGDPRDAGQSFTVRSDGAVIIESTPKFGVQYTRAVRGG